MVLWSSPWAADFGHQQVRPKGVVCQIPRQLPGRLLSVVVVRQVVVVAVAVEVVEWSLLGQVQRQDSHLLQGRLAVTPKEVPLSLLL